MKTTLTVLALGFALATSASAETLTITRQKACSNEFRAMPKESRGGLAGWQTFYKECNARLKADGNTYAKRTRSAKAAD